MTIGKNAWRWIGRILAGLLAALLLALLYLTLIVGQPQPKEEAEAAPQPLLTASPRMNISAEADLYSLIAAFPVPVMSFMSGSGNLFVSAESADAAWQGGFGRIATLYWQTEDGYPLILQSIYPASALDLMGRGDYSFSGIAGPALFGHASVRMENAATVRVHTVTDEGIYVLTAPRDLAPSLSALARSIQLFTVTE